MNKAQDEQVVVDDQTENDNKVDTFEMKIGELEQKQAQRFTEMEGRLIDKLKELIKPPEPALKKTEGDEELSLLRRELEAIKREHEADKKAIAQARAREKLIGAGADPQLITSLGDKLALNGDESDEQLAKIATALKKAPAINDTRMTRRASVMNGKVPLSEKQRRIMQQMGFDPDTREYLG